MVNGFLIPGGHFIFQGFCFLYLFSGMKFITEDQLEQQLTYQILIPSLENHLADDINVPQRAHLHLDYGMGEDDPSLLIMPAWKNKAYIGIKLVNIFPANKQLPSIQGIYILMGGTNGQNLCMIDAKKLTTKRTAATSALMSKFLSRRDSKTLLICGTGHLAPELARAHCSVRSIEHVLIWGRNTAKSVKLAAQLEKELEIIVDHCEDVEAGCAQADIISTATMSVDPIIYGQWVKPGTHVDLVGSYKPNMREGDNHLIQKATVFVDTIEGATTESGDLVIPLAENVINLEDIQSTLFDLCKGSHPGRQNEEEITWFKSVGHAAEDLIAAYTLFEMIQNP